MSCPGDPSYPSAGPVSAGLTLSVRRMWTPTMGPSAADAGQPCVARNAAWRANVAAEGRNR
jgi:hypothetical protein